MCLDLEGVLLPEIWKGVAHKTGIKELELTTRNIPDYNQLMSNRLRIMNQNKLDLSVLQEVVAQLEPLAGAKDFLDWLRTEFQVVILSDTFHEIASPLMEKLSFPLLLCHTLKVKEGMIDSYQLRQEKAKQEAIRAFQNLGYRCFAAGDSFNDIQMFEVCEKGFFINAPKKVTSQHPEIEVVNGYTELKNKLLENSIYQNE